MSQWLLSASTWLIWVFALIAVALLAAAAVNAGSAQTRTRAKVYGVWALPSFALAFLAFNLWAIGGDIDNLEHGLRPERLAVAGIVVVIALVLAVTITLRSRRIRSQHGSVAA